MHTANRKYIKQFSLTRIPQAMRPLANRTSGYKHTIKIYLTGMRREGRDEVEIAQDMV
jgi:hypothetical protein